MAVPLNVCPFGTLRGLTWIETSPLMRIEQPGPLLVPASWAIVADVSLDSFGPGPGSSELG